ncbi:MAG: metalloregulator ArsR/SmtB family transcription factor [Proteobacteria bacterium]|nr:metalloregulator ArsR/SmtB family transcription factor [Pseudomonadota bacterium]MBU1688607.1 metalloregulator ArsR/SmtB family transcription factor [Pseudomonadota bacterium]
MKQLIRVMKALSDPNRIKVMKMLEAKPLCVCEITEILKLAQSTVSKHLKILEDAELIDSWKEGPWVIYRLAKNPANQYAKTIQGHLGEWLFDNPEIRKVYRQAQVADKQKICAA